MSLKVDAKFEIIQGATYDSQGSNKTRYWVVFKNLENGNVVERFSVQIELRIDDYTENPDGSISFTFNGPKWFRVSTTDIVPLPDESPRALQELRPRARPKRRARALTTYNMYKYLVNDDPENLTSIWSHQTQLSSYFDSGIISVMDKIPAEAIQGVGSYTLRYGEEVIIPYTRILKFYNDSVESDDECDIFIGGTFKNDKGKLYICGKVYKGGWLSCELNQLQHKAFKNDWVDIPKGHINNQNNACDFSVNTGFVAQQHDNVWKQTKLEETNE